MYYCNSCGTEKSDDDIEFNTICDDYFCPHCMSSDVDYFNCDVSTNPLSDDIHETGYDGDGD